MRKLFLVVLFIFTACSHHTVKPQIGVQIPTLKTHNQQFNAILEVIKDNKYTDYQYDSEAIETGRVKSVNAYDHWNFASYYEIQKIKKQIEAGIENISNAKVDCDDTMIHLYIALLKKGYPADQLSWNFYLVPPSTMTGVIQQLGGHAVLIAEVEGDVPYSLEDISKPRPVWEIEETLGYYNVGFKPMDEDIRTPWYFTDKYGYEKLSKEEISVDVAKSYPAYKNRTNWTHTIFHRGGN